MNRSRPPRGLCSLLTAVLLLALCVASPASAQDHDLVLQPAPDVTHPTDSTQWHSPDVKLGADFGDASVPDLVRRGVTIPVYGRFYVNGVQDFSVPSGAAVLRFHYRNASVGEAPPDLTAPGAGWQLIGSLPITYAGTDPFPFLAITQTWPTDYPSVATRHVDWAVPAAGDYFHVRAEAVYPVGTEDDNDGDNVAVSLYESILGLRDVDLVIVHDVSGSMLSFSHAGSSYLDQAKARAQAFVLSMNENHRLAVVAFGGCLPGDVADVWPMPVPPMQQATWGNKLAAVGAISANVSAANFGCLTPLGTGLQRAVQILNATPLDPTRKRAVLLLTDGYENSGVPRACNGADPAGPCLGTAVLAQLQAAHARVFSIALGAAAAVDCLECLTDGSDGQWYAPAGPGIDLAEVYLDMQQAYSADDLYRADRGTSGGGDDTYGTHFEGLDDLLWFILQSDELDAEIDLEIRPPGGDWYAAASLPDARVERDRGYTVVRVEGPDAGTWQYRVVGEEGKDYLVAVRSDRVGVRLALDVKTRGRVGEPIHVLARLTDRGEPVDVDSLTATVQVPVGASLNNVLRDQSRKHLARTGTWPVDLRQLRRRPDTDPRAAFIARLLRGESRRLVKTRDVEVKLERQRDGSFRGVLEAPTRVAGEYKVTVTYGGKGADRRQSRSVRLAPAELDLRASFAELVAVRHRDGEERRWLVRVYLVDRYGNAVSDAAELQRLRFELRGAEPAGKPEVAFDGALQQPLQVPRGGKPVLDAVLLRDKKLRIEGRDDVIDGRVPR